MASPDPTREAVILRFWPASAGFFHARSYFLLNDSFISYTPLLNFGTLNENEFVVSDTDA